MHILRGGTSRGSIWWSLRMNPGVDVYIHGVNHHTTAPQEQDDVACLDPFASGHLKVEHACCCHVFSEWLHRYTMVTTYQGRWTIEECKLHCRPRQQTCSIHPLQPRNWRLRKRQWPRIAPCSSTTSTWHLGARFGSRKSQIYQNISARQWRVPGRA